MVTKEQWRDVVGYEGLYKVSDLGKVFGRCKILRPGTERSGHQYVILCKYGTPNKTAKIHRLVLEAFVGPCPEKCECAHRDGNPKNNKLSNLRWATPKENQADRIRHGTDIRGEDHKNAKLTEMDVRNIKRARIRGNTYRSIAAIYGVSHPLIIRIVQGRAWAHI